MRKKKYIFWFVFLIAALFVTTSVFAQGEVPPIETTPPLTVAQFPWVEVFIVAFATFIATLGIKSISAVFGIDISGKASAITAAIVLLIVELINTALGLVPEEAKPAVVSGLGFVFTLLSAFGFAGLLKKITTKPTPAEPIK